MIQGTMNFYPFLSGFHLNLVTLRELRLEQEEALGEDHPYFASKYMNGSGMRMLKTGLGVPVWQHDGFNKARMKYTGHWELAYASKLEKQWLCDKVVWPVKVNGRWTFPVIKHTDEEGRGGVNLMFEAAIGELRQAFGVLECLEAHGDARTKKLDVLKKNASNSFLKRMVMLTYGIGQNYYITTQAYVPTELQSDAQCGHCKWYGTCIHSAKVKYEDSYPSCQKKGWYKGTPVGDPTLENWVKFTTILEQLSTGALSGNAARAAWKGLLDGCSQYEAKWYNRVLNRDLRVGLASFGTIWSEARSNFGVKAALDYDDANTELTFPVIAEPKCDGFRFMHVNGSTIQRSGLHYTPLFGWASKMWHSVSERYADSEYLADFDKDDPRDNRWDAVWNKTNSLVTTGRPGKGGWTEAAVEAMDPAWRERQKAEGAFWLFDSLPDTVFAEMDTTPFWKRRLHLRDDFIKLLIEQTNSEERAAERATLLEIQKGLNDAYATSDYREIERCDAEFNKLSRSMGIPFVLMPQKVCLNSDDVQAFYEECLAKGFEGIIIKSMDGGYLANEGRRDTSWLKKVPHASVDAKVIGFKEGTGKLVGHLGSFVVETPEGAVMRCTGWLSQAEKKYIWEHQDEWLGAIVQMEYRDDTQAVTGDTGVVRFGQFIRRRTDKEDAEMVAASK